MFLTPLALMALSSVEAISQEPAPYDSTLKALTDFIMAGQGLSQESYPNEYTGIAEIVTYGQENKDAEKLEYLIKDISGDGVPELLVFNNNGYQEDHPYSEILLVYTLKDGKAIPIINGWSRNSFGFSEDKKFVNLGSNGATESFTRSFKLSSDAISRQYYETYFTAPVNKDSDEIGYFYGKTDSQDPQQATRLPDNDEEFIKQSDALANKRIVLKGERLINNVSKGENRELSFDVQDFTKQKNNLLEDASLMRFSQGEEEYDVTIKLSPNSDCQDFAFLRLEMQDVTPDGKPIFKKSKLFSKKKVLSGSPMFFTIDFLGSTPNWGFSCVDNAGKKQSFVLYQSGEDSSIGISKEKNKKGFISDRFFEQYSSYFKHL